MKRALILVVAFVALTIYIYSNRTPEVEKEVLLDPILPEESMGGTFANPSKLGGTVKEDKVTDIATIAEMQTDFAMYFNGKMNFQEMTNRNIVNLKNVFIYPYKAQKGWLFSVGYDYDSRIQVYAQSSLDDTQTVIYKVTYNEGGNKVEKIYDGEYFKLTSVDLEDPTKLIGFDANHDKHYMEVTE